MQLCALLICLLSAVLAFGHQQTFASRRSICHLNTTASNTNNITKGLKAEVDDPRDNDYIMSEYTPANPDGKLTYYQFAPDSKSTIILVQLSVNTVSDTMNQYLLYIDDINLSKDPSKLPFRMSDFQLGFWKFCIGRDLGHFNRLQYNVVIEPSVVSSVQAAYAKMGARHGEENLTVKHNSNDPDEQAAYTELLTNNKFGKSAAHLLNDYEGMSGRNLGVCKFDVLALRSDDTGMSLGVFDLVLTFGKVWKLMRMSSLPSMGKHSPQCVRNARGNGTSWCVTRGRTADQT